MTRAAITTTEKKTGDRVHTCTLTFDGVSVRIDYDHKAVRIDTPPAQFASLPNRIDLTFAQSETLISLLREHRLIP